MQVLLWWQLKVENAYKNLRDFNLAKDFGILPSNLLLYKSMLIRFFSLPNSFGIFPLMLFRYSSLKSIKYTQLHQNGTQYLIREVLCSLKETLGLFMWGNQEICCDERLNIFIIQCLWQQTNYAEIKIT